jgi:hypothetical protein
MVLPLALTPTLSAGEREKLRSAYEKCVLTIAVAVSLPLDRRSSQQTATSISPSNGESFSLSWGRGPG